MAKRKTKKNNDLSTRRVFAIVVVSFAIIFLLVVLFVTLAKSTMGDLINYVRSDESLADFRSSSSVAIMSASTGESKAETFRASGDNLNQALSRLAKRVKESPDYPSYIYFRLDVAPFSPAAADNIISNFPDPSAYSYFTSTNSKPYSLTAADDYGPENMFMNSAYYLANEIGEDGKFAIDPYSISTHVSSVITLINTYSISKDPWLLHKIETALDCLEPYLKYFDYEDDSLGGALMQNYEKNLLTLSDSSLTAIAYANYSNITGSDRYAEKLADLVAGIEMLRLNDDDACSGAYYYLYQQDMTLDFKDPDTMGDYSRLYDAQATLALIEASKTLDDEDILKSAVVNLEDFLRKDYTGEGDAYWIINAVVNYLYLRPESDNKYYQFIVDSISPALSSLVETVDSYPAYFESLSLVAQALSLADTYDIELSLPDSFREDLHRALENQLDATTALFRPAPSAIYTSSPSDFVNSFSSKESESPADIETSSSLTNALFYYLGYYLETI